ncbi:SART-1 protein [Dimargaris cristalligena]|uniref:SART-1 protein n=1 Tax=Dimargaris cristalligena TaxID=215637 RepID=A0A4Q0A2G4_9FUNG|nr:SART-1 protein [Dimargaris cristalligena]|eukprot:RKP40303.1 SART-1 protein [Dimargaris cristalligena]
MDTHSGRDYYTPEKSDALFRASHKKRKRSKQIRIKQTDGPPPTDSAASMQVDGEPNEEANPAEWGDDSNIVDDDDLQHALARTRRVKAAQRFKPTLSTPEQLAENYRQKAAAAMDQDDTEPEHVLSETIDFVNNLGDVSLVARTTARTEPSTPSILAMNPVDTTEPSGASTTPTAVSAQPASPHDVAATPVPPPSITHSSTSAGTTTSVADIPTEEQAGVSVTEQEPLVSDGLAATLALLNQKGIIKSKTEAELRQERDYQSRQAWIAEQRRKDRQREMDELHEREERRRTRGKEPQRRGHEAEQRREAEASQRDRERAREIQERMRDYKPDVRLEYADEYGQSLTPKEAFKQLSHKFHGKYSGKTKTEKRLRKMEQERKRLATNSTDTPLQLASIFQQQQEASGSAYVVLSTGNKLGVNNLDFAPNQKD